MLKFDFSVKTCDGQNIAGITIHANDWADAERKLRQMHHDCEVTHCNVDDPGKNSPQSVDIEGMLSLIAKDT